MSLGSQIRRYRESLSLTLEQLAERTGVDVGTISALEVRSSDRSKYAAQIAKGFGLSLEQLLDESADHLKAGAAQDSHARTAQVTEAREPQTSYSHWPFSNVSPSEYAQLDDVQRAKVEGFVQGMLISGKQRRAGRT